MTNWSEVARLCDGWFDADERHACEILCSPSLWLTGTSPLVILLTNAGRGSNSITWKCSSAAIDLSDTQFLNQITCSLGDRSSICIAGSLVPACSFRTSSSIPRLPAKYCAELSGLCCCSSRMKTLATKSSISLITHGCRKPVSGSSSRSNLVHTQRWTIRGSTPYGQSFDRILYWLGALKRVVGPGTWTFAGKQSSGHWRRSCRTKSATET